LHRINQAVRETLDVISLADIASPALAAAVPRVDIRQRCDALPS
jgi:hypothetical protein